MPVDPDVSPSDFEAHEARVCIQKGQALDDPRRSKNFVENQYLRSPEEMKELFIDLPEALENTVKIAEKCNLDLELGEFYLPDFDVPEGQTREEHLKQLSYEGLNKRILQINSSVNSFWCIVTQRYSVISSGSVNCGACSQG